MFKLTLALGLLPAVFAANYTTTLLLIGMGTQDILGSVIATDATATTYALTCANVNESWGCGLPENFKVTQGPSTMHYTIAYEDDMPGSLDVGCTITSDHGVCSGSVVMTGEVTATDFEEYPATTETYSNFGKGIGAQVVTVTAVAAAAAVTSVSTAGVPMITGKAQWVVGGAAAMAAYAAM